MITCLQSIYFTTFINNMELIYLYIDDDGKNIKDCEFNFSPEYRISYNRKQRFITIEKNDCYLPYFWEVSNISNITAIIGKNGAGKSNLLEFIFRYYTSRDVPARNLIHIYRLNGELYINGPDIPCNIPLREIHYTSYPLNDFNKAVNTKLIYYSPHYEKNVLYDLGQGITSIDVSTGGLLRKYGKDRLGTKSQTHSDIDRLIIEDTFRQIDLFVFSNAAYFESINLPYALNITFKEGANRLNTDSELYNKLFIDKPLSVLSFPEHVANRFLYFLFKNKEYISTLRLENENATFDEFIKETYANKLYFELIRLYESNSIIFKEYPQRMGSRRDYLLTFGIKRENISFDLYVGLYHYYFKGEAFADFKYFNMRSVLYNDIILSWTGLSAGELEYLNFLSRIYSSINEVIVNHGSKRKIPKKPDKINNIILLLDEPESSFHPEWQRLFLDNLLHFLNNVLPYYIFQIILASHSPILVSDFPKENIIFLDKDQNGVCKVADSICKDNTFGANIHTLYRNSFFIDGLPIGEFAKKRINKLFEELASTQPIRPSILKEIQMIGEPIFRDQLMKLYKQREGLPEDVNRRISELEKEIKILKEKLNDKN